MANKRLKSIYVTTYDGFIISLYSNGDIEAYEGLALCKPTVKKWIANGKFAKIQAFHNDAIAYGMIK